MKKNIKYLWAIAVVVPALWGCTRIPGDLGQLNYNPVKRAMVPINGGTFQMGQINIATPVHQVTVSSFLIDNTDVTQGDYQAVMNVNPSYFPGESLRPVEQVTWYDAVLYCNTRSKLAGLDTVYSFSLVRHGTSNECDSLGNLVIDYSKKGYRLPTEAEWEYACRAGSTTRYYWGDAMDLDYCWDTTNSGLGPQPVGQKVPNDFGLYDMSGEVYQWCNDWYNVYPSTSLTDPTGPASGTKRVLRGGSWGDHEFALSSAFRASNVTNVQFIDVGFRCVLAASVPPPVLRLPANGATDQPLPLTLSWFSVSNATGYYMQVSTSDSFTTVAFEDTGLIPTSTTRTISGLSGGVTYYWRVIAANANDKGAWSAVWSFTTAASSLQAPTLLSPMGTATNQPLVLALSWSTVTNATGYHVQVSTSSSFSSVSIEDSTLTATSRTIGNLAPGTTYYWRVRAKNAGGFSAWSGTWSFVTAATSPDTMKFIAGGTFTMGSSNVLDYNGSPPHQVTVSSFYMDSALVSQAEYQSLMGVNPSFFTGYTYKPVEQVTWFDAVLYCNARSKRDKRDTVYTFTSITGGIGNGCTGLGNIRADSSKNGYRLPTDAEFEYAHRAGTTTSYFWGSDTTVALAYAWWQNNSLNTTQRVASKLPNGWKLYDMSGNVWEWCNDWFAAYTSSVQTDPTGPSTGTTRVLRGGSWRDFGGALRSAYRSSGGPAVIFNSYGFRCVRKYFAVTLPQAPTLASPLSGAAAQSLPLTLTWSAVANATSFRLQVSSDSTFATVTVNDSTLVSASKTVDSLLGGVKYFWRVRSKNASGVSGWTAAWSFTTVMPAIPAAPSLVSPLSGSTTQSITPTLVWSKVSGAATYYVQVSTTPMFAPVVFQDSTLTADSIKVSGLAASATYRWRVRAKNAAGVSAWSAVWNFTTAASGTVTDIDGNVYHTVTIGTQVWMVENLKTTRYNDGTAIPLVTDPTIWGTITTDGYCWYNNDSATYGNTYGAMYDWYAVNTGKLAPTGWHVPSDAEWEVLGNFLGGDIVAGGPLKEAGMTHWASPNTGATNVTGFSARPGGMRGYAATGTYSGLDTNGFWWSSTGSNDYNATFSWKREMDYNSASVTRTTSGKQNGFSVRCVKDNTPPVAPSITTPPQTQTVTAGQSVTFSVVATGTALLSYQWYKDGTAISGATSSSYSISNVQVANAGTYTVTVSNGTLPNATSNGAVLTVNPAVPVLVSPVNGAPNQPQILTLVWSPAGGASGYRVQVSTSSIFATLIVDDSTLTAANRAIGTLNPSTTYYWRVCAKNATGVSAWTSPWSFTTSTAPLPSPVLNSPANGATGVSMPATLTWSTVTGATTYHVQVSIDSSFTSFVKDDSTLTAATTTINYPPVPVTFYWRVQAKNASGVSAWTATWVFYTGGALPAPVLSSPANGTTALNPMGLTLSWSTVSTATSYRVQVSSDSTFTIVNVEDSALTSVSKTIDSLSRGVKYFWRVRAKNASGVSSWTTPWSFTTIMPSIPSVPSLVSPANGATNQSRRPTLTWSSVSGATSYHIQVSGDPGFTAVVAVDSSLTGASKTLDSLLAGGAVYFWRVRAKNAAGVSAWTSAWNFTTTAAAGPWIARADLPAAIIYMGVAVVNNKIYAFGGYDGSSYTNGVYLYDPAADTWTTYGTMTAARAPAAAAVNGKIYAIGGGDIGTVEEYDPVNKTWSPRMDMPTVRGPAVAVVDSLIYAIGGYNSISGSLGTNESYDPSSDKWTVLASMTARNSTPVAAAGGKVYAFGGEYWPNTPLDLVQEYDPSGNAWVTKTALPSPRTRAAAATVNGKIYVIGGTNDVMDLAEVESYDPSSDTWTAKTAMPTARSGSGIAVVNGKIYVIGGSSSSNPRLTTVEEYDPLLDP